MTIKKLLCIVFALVLALGCVAYAEEDLQAELDAAKLRIAELEDLVETYYPYYAAQIAATYGENGIVWVDDVLEEYEYIEAQYASYGMSLADYGMDAYMKEQVLGTLVQTGIIMDKEAELGLNTVDDEFIAEAELAADELIEEYVDYYISYYYADAEEITDEMRAEAEAYWAANGLDKDSYVQSSKEDAIVNAMYEYAVKDVSVDEDEIQQEYEAMVAENEATYADDPDSYISDVSSGAAIACHPEGFRMVKQVLIQFDDEQSSRYSDLQTQLSALNAEREAVLSSEETEETDAEQRTLAEIDADIAACATEVEALYALLLPEAEEVIEKFNNGTDIETLIAEYNDDPGMQQGLSAEIGYAICADNNTWDPTFTEAAMSIEKAGQLSEPAYGSYGIYLVYYFSDVEAGEVGLEAIREEVEANALENKRSEAYDAALAQWIEEANVTYYYENLGIGA